MPDPPEAAFQVIPVDAELSAVKTYVSVPTGNLDKVLPLPTNRSPLA